jgi:hypothetical protein
MTATYNKIQERLNNDFSGEWTISLMVGTYLIQINQSKNNEIISAPMEISFEIPMIYWKQEDELYDYILGYIQINYPEYLL